MTFPRPAACLAAAACLLAAPRPYAPELQEAARKTAERVLRTLDRIEAESLSGRKGRLKRIDFSEEELNAYVACRIEAEKEGALRDLALKLFADNRVEGKAFLDLGGANLPFGLKPRLHLYFEGRVETRGGAVKLGFAKLFIEDRAVPLTLLDLIIATAAAAGKADGGSINDWYALPYGIKEIKTGRQKISLYYGP
jgi:hypothetical protein